MQRVDDGPLASDLSQYLQGFTFPALKHDVIHALRQNHAPDLVVEQVQELPVTEFKSLEQLLTTYRENDENDPSPHVPEPGKRSRQ